jgi:hypothetical protein
MLYRDARDSIICRTRKFFSATAARIALVMLVAGSTIPKVGDLPDSLQALSHRQAIELGDSSFARDVKRLVQQLKEIASLVAEERRERAAAENCAAANRRRRRASSRKPVPQAG